MSSDELSDQKIDTLAEYARIHHKKRNHCPTCFKAYELVDNELTHTCFCPQNSNLCGRCGVNNCTRH